MSTFTSFENLGCCSSFASCFHFLGLLCRKIFISSVCSHYNRRSQRNDIRIYDTAQLLLFLIPTCTRLPYHMIQTFFLLLLILPLLSKHASREMRKKFFTFVSFFAAFILVSKISKWSNEICCCCCWSRLCTISKGKRMKLLIFNETS